MNRIKFIYETKPKRIFISLLSACILILIVVGLFVDNSGFFYGAATGGFLYCLFELVSLFLNRNFVYVAHNHMLIRVNTFFFKTILFDRIEGVDISETVLHIHLSNKIIVIQTKGIDEQDVKQLELLISKLAKA